MVAIPQKDRWKRIILDVSFSFYPSEVNREANTIQARMNETTEWLAPDAPVKEMGNVFHRIFHFIDSIAEGEVVMLANINLSDGFRRMIVK